MLLIFMLVIKHKNKNKKTWQKNQIQKKCIKNKNKKTYKNANKKPKLTHKNKKLTEKLKKIK